MWSTQILHLYFNFKNVYVYVKNFIQILALYFIDKTI